MTVEVPVAPKVGSEWDRFAERMLTARQRHRDDARDEKDFEALAQHSSVLDDPLRPGAGLVRPTTDDDFFGPSPKERAPLISVIDDTLPFAVFQRGFEQNLVCLCRALGPRARRAVQRQAVVDTLRQGIAPILSGHDQGAAANAVNDVANAFDTHEKNPTECIAALHNVGRSFSERDENCWGPIFAGIELFEVVGDSRAAAVGFMLFRSARLAAAIPARQAVTSTVSGRSGSIAVPSHVAETAPIEEADVARSVALQLRGELRAQGVHGWAALAPLAGEVDCYFGSIPERKRKNAASKLEVEPADLLGLIDLTVLGSAKSCVCFFRERVMFRNDWTAKAPGVFTLPFSKLSNTRTLGSTEIEVPEIGAAISVAGTTLDPASLIEVFETLSQVASLEPWLDDDDKATD